MNVPLSLEIPASSNGKTGRNPKTNEELVPGTSKVRLNVARLADLDLWSACKSHLLATKDNPLFEDLQPDDEVYQAQITDFFGSVTEIAHLKSQLEAAYSRRDSKRAALETGTRMRISGVQMASKGDSAGISSAGFATNKTPSPIGYLSAPLSLIVTLGRNAGSMEITWEAVKKNRGYLLQYAEGQKGDENPNWILIVSHKPKLILPDMTPGTSYLFRIATIGGKGGQSAWSPTVVRVAG